MIGYPLDTRFICSDSRWPTQRSIEPNDDPGSSLRRVPVGTQKDRRNKVKET